MDWTEWPEFSVQKSHTHATLAFYNLENITHKLNLTYSEQKVVIVVLVVGQECFAGQPLIFQGYWYVADSGCEIIRFPGHPRTLWKAKDFPIKIKAYESRSLWNSYHFSQGFQFEIQAQIWVSITSFGVLEIREPSNFALCFLCLKEICNWSLHNEKLGNSV